MPGDITPYLALITSEHASKPNFVATVAATVQPMADAIAVLQSLPAAFDIDQAVGAQLDVVGEWVGASRELAVPLTNVYFSLDVAGLGLDQGNLYGPFDPITGLVSLPDDTYRVLLKATIAANRWDGTIPGAYVAYTDLFSALGGQILIFDNQDMTITLGYAGTPPNAVVQALLTNGELSLRPATVGITGYFTPSVQGAPFFGLDAETSAISGLDTGALAIPL